MVGLEKLSNPQALDVTQYTQYTRSLPKLMRRRWLHPSTVSLVFLLSGLQVSGK